MNFHKFINFLKKHKKVFPLNLFVFVIKKILTTKTVLKNDRKLKNERKYLKKIAENLKLSINPLSAKEWQECFNQEKLSENQLLDFIRFLASAVCFKKTEKHFLLFEALKIYSQNEDQKKFIYLADFIIKETGILIAGYYALEKSLNNAPYKKLEDYLHYICLHQMDLNESQKRRFLLTLAQLRILRKPVPPKGERKFSHYKSEENTIFYILHNSEPYMNFGYASRSRGVMSSLQKDGYKVYGVTRFGFPHDRLDLKDSIHLRENTPLTDKVGDLEYWRLLAKKGQGLFEQPLDEYILEAKNAIIELAYLKKPSKIIAASNFYTAFPALLAARELGIPLIYEVRGFWEVTRYSSVPDWKNSYDHKFYVAMENKTALGADKVLTLTQAMKDLIEKRSNGKVSAEIISNAVTPREDVSSRRNEELATQLGIKSNEKVIGFIGRIVQYEGLDLLMQAATQLKDLPCKFLIVGSGESLEALKEFSKKLSLEEVFIFIGRVPYNEVQEYYTLIDLVILPRLPQPVCELVSPLKPFEAMAEKKLLLMSDVAPMKEFTIEGVNGFLFEKGNINSLVSQIKRILFSQEKFEKTKESAREWVLENRTWDFAAKKIHHVLNHL